MTDVNKYRWRAKVNGRQGPWLRFQGDDVPWDDWSTERMTRAEPTRGLSPTARMFRVDSPRYSAKTHPAEFGVFEWDT